MATEFYWHKRFTRAHTKVIAQANVILEEYAMQGFVLTLRQLYYKFVARGYIPNNHKSYKRLGSIIGSARLAGKIDWERIEDRMRSLAVLQHFRGPQDALDKLAGWYHIDMWAGQEYRPEVWIEKDALSGVIAGVCDENDVPYFCCRGYTSLSEMWRASQRLKRHSANGQKPFIIHFGDHDPSGIDMSRDIQDRLQEMFRAECGFLRVALTMEQVEEYQPPPNPAKVRDSRYKSYRDNYGEESWELDALEPAKFRELIEDKINEFRDEAQWKKDSTTRAAIKQQLIELAKDWEDVGRNKRKAKELESVVNAANAAGWNGADNSKLLTQFIADTAKDNKRLVAEVQKLKSRKKRVS